MLNFSDAGSVLKGGLLGCVMGVLYQVSFLAADRLLNPRSLDIPTDILHADTELCQLFSQLQEHRMIDDRAFEASIVNADRMLFLLHQLSNKKIKATINDRVLGFSNYKSTIGSVERMVAAAHTRAEAPVEAKLHQIYTGIYESLTSHWKSILKLTADI